MTTLEHLAACLVQDWNLTLSHYSHTTAGDGYRATLTSARWDTTIDCGVRPTLALAIESAYLAVQEYL